MHELGIVFHIIRTVEDVAKESHVARIQRVTLQLGEVSGVVESYLHAAGLALDAEGCLVAWKPGDDMEEAEEQDEEGRPVRKSRPALQARGWNAPDAPWAVALALPALASLLLMQVHAFLSFRF